VNFSHGLEPMKPLAPVIRMRAYCMSLTPSFRLKAVPFAGVRHRPPP
jgi:hypothetical protein